MGINIERYREVRARPQNSSDGVAAGQCLVGAGMKHDRDRGSEGRAEAGGLDPPRELGSSATAEALARNTAADVAAYDANQWGAVGQQGGGGGGVGGDEVDGRVGAQDGSAATVACEHDAHGEGAPSCQEGQEIAAAEEPGMSEFVRAFDGGEPLACVESPVGLAPTSDGRSPRLEPRARTPPLHAAVADGKWYQSEGTRTRTAIERFDASVSSNAYNRLLREQAVGDNDERKAGAAEDEGHADNETDIEDDPEGNAAHKKDDLGIIKMAFKKRKLTSPGQTDADDATLVVQSLRAEPVTIDGGVDSTVPDDDDDDDDEEEDGVDDLPSDVDEGDGEVRQIMTAPRPTPNLSEASLLGATTAERTLAMHALPGNCHDALPPAEHTRPPPAMPPATPRRFSTALKMAMPLELPKRLVTWNDQLIMQSSPGPEKFSIKHLLFYEDHEVPRSMSPEFVDFMADYKDRTPRAAAAWLHQQLCPFDDDDDDDGAMSVDYEDHAQAVPLKDKVVAKTGVHLIGEEELNNQRCRRASRGRTAPEPFWLTTARELLGEGKMTAAKVAKEVMLEADFHDENVCLDDVRIDDETVPDEAVVALKYELARASTR